MDYAVGPYEWQRQSYLVGFPGIGGIGTGIGAVINQGRINNFIGGVEQLLNQETIDTLKNLKKGGTTLGALSDEERKMLQKAATKIGQWKIVDPKTGKTTGYEIDEKSFKEELIKLQSLARKAAQEAAGTALGEEDSAQVDSLLGNQANLTDEQLMANF